MLVLCPMLGYVKRPGRSGGREKASMGLEVHDLGKREKWLGHCLILCSWGGVLTVSLGPTGRPAGFTGKIWTRKP